MTRWSSADAGPQEIRLRAGSHRVQAIKDGKAVRDQLVTITRGGKEIVNVDFEPAETATVAETKNPPDMSTPRSHVNQCMNCHSNVRALKADEPLPTKHPALDAWPASANTHTDLSAGMGAEGSQSVAPWSGVSLSRRTGAVWRLASKASTGPRRSSGSGTWRSAGTPSGSSTPSVIGALPSRRTAEPWPRGTSTGLCRRSYSPTNGRSTTAKTRVRRSIPWRSSPIARFSPPETGTAGSGSMVRTPSPIAVHSSIRPGSGPLPSARMDRRWRSGAKRNTIQVYDLATRRLKATLDGHTHAVKSLDFSPDGKLLASAGGTTVRLWDTATWKDSWRALRA